MAGPEAWRTLVWGSPFARSLGLTLLPSLAEDDIWAIDDGLDRLDQEVSTLFENVERLGQEAKRSSENITHYLTNMRNAVAEAKEIDGGVVIW